MLINLCKIPDYTGERIMLDSFKDIDEAIKTARGYIDVAEGLGEDIELIIDYHFERKEKTQYGGE